MRLNRGMLAPYLKCPDCGQISRQEILFKRAIWIWPLTIGLFLLALALLRRYLYAEAQVLYVAIGIAMLVPVVVGYRLGMRLVAVELQEDRRGGAARWFVPILALIVFSVLFGYYTRDWTNVVVGAVVGSVTLAIFYYLGRRNQVQ